MSTSGGTTPLQSQKPPPLLGPGVGSIGMVVG